MFPCDDASAAVPLDELSPLDDVIRFFPRQERLRELEDGNRRRLATLGTRQRIARETAEHYSSDEEETATTNGVKSTILNGELTCKCGEGAKEESEEPFEVGMQCGLKNLYSGKEDKRGRFRWQDTIPADVGKPAEDAETAKWALLVRNVKVYNDPRKVLAIQ